MPFICPHVDNCCGCITDLKTAAAIIAVLAIVTNPIASWLLVRHSYAVRVSCYLTAINRVDIVDLNIKNIISFGFGINAGLGSSCLTNETVSNSTVDYSVITKVVQGLGWIALFGDLVFLITSMIFLMKIFRIQTRRIVKLFMMSALIAVMLSTTYGVSYVIMCAVTGKGIALCEIVLSVVDIITWMYFLVVLRSNVGVELPSS